MSWLCTLFLKREVRTKHPCVVFYHVPYTNCFLYHPEGKSSLQKPDHYHLTGCSGVSAQYSGWYFQYPTGYRQVAWAPPDHRSGRQRSEHKGLWDLVLYLVPLSQSCGAPPKLSRQVAAQTQHRCHAGGPVCPHIYRFVCHIPPTGPRHPVKPVSIPRTYQFHRGLVSFRTAWHKHSWRKSKSEDHSGTTVSWQHR